MAATHWYYRVGDSEHGPVDGSGLKRAVAAGTVTAETPIRRSDMDRWLPASRVKGLLPTQPQETDSGGGHGSPPRTNPADDQRPPATGSASAAAIGATAPATEPAASENPFAPPEDPAGAAARREPTAGAGIDRQPRGRPGAMVRCGALILDFTIIQLGVSILGFVTLLSDQLAESFARIEVALIALAFLGYKLAMEARFGATVGKMATGSWVRNDSGGALPFIQVLIRNHYWVLFTIVSLLLTVMGPEGMLRSKGLVFAMLILMSLYALALLIATGASSDRRHFGDRLAKADLVRSLDAPPLREPDPRTTPRGALA